MADAPYDPYVPKNGAPGEDNSKTGNLQRVSWIYRRKTLV